MDGVVRWPSLLGMTTGSLPSITATHEFVVPKSIPMIFPIFVCFLLLLILLASQSVFSGRGNKLATTVPKTNVSDSQGENH
jgi:hypothetical protein